MPSLASLLNLGGPDLIVILSIVLLLFGAKKLPDVARRMGQAVRESDEDDGFFKMSALEFLMSACLALLLIAAMGLIIPHH